MVFSSKENSLLDIHQFHFELWKWLFCLLAGTSNCWYKGEMASDSIHLMTLDFLFGSHLKKLLLSSLACIPQPNQKLELWKASLHNQINKLHVSHPLLNHTPVYGILSDRNFFLHLLQSSKWISDFIKFNHSRRPSESLMETFQPFYYPTRLFETIWNLTTLYQTVRSIAWS